MKQYSVALDGPSGAGKSTIAKAVAAKLGLLYVDTGAIYRSVGYAAFLRKIEPDDAENITKMLPKLRIEMKYAADGLQHMYLDGEDITTQIRLPEISMYASKVSAIPAVRAFLLEMQRKFAREQSVIMDGRDIGTVVLPHAQVKVFLTADAKERAKRRYLELEKRGTPRPYDEVLKEVNERDYNDMHRAIAPLCQAEDAILLDTTNLDFDESVQALLTIIEKAVEV